MAKPIRRLHSEKVSACCKARWYYAPKYYDGFMKYKEVPVCMGCGKETELIKRNETK